jgi:hypothetical protein
VKEFIIFCSSDFSFTQLVNGISTQRLDGWCQTPRQDPSYSVYSKNIRHIALPCGLTHGVSDASYANQGIENFASPRDRAIWFFAYAVGELRNPDRRSVCFP